MFSTRKIMAGKRLKCQLYLDYKMLLTIESYRRYCTVWNSSDTQLVELYIILLYLLHARRLTNVAIRVCSPCLYEVNLLFMLGYFACFVFLSSAQKESEIPSDCQIVWIPIRPDNSVSPDLCPHCLQRLSALSRQQKSQLARKELTKERHRLSGIPSENRSSDT